MALCVPVRELKIPHEKSEFGVVTVSIGITTGSNIHLNTRDDYLKKADEALYISKKEGRNRSTICVLT